MAETEQEVLTVEAILEQIYQGLSTDEADWKISLEQAIYMAAPFPELQQLIEENAAEIAGIIRNKELPSGDKVEKLRGVFGPKVDRVLGSNQHPNHPLQDAEVKNRAKKLTTELQDVYKTLTEKESALRKQNKIFIEEITTQFTGRNIESVKKRLAAELDAIQMTAGGNSIREEVQTAIDTSLREHEIIQSPEVIAQAVKERDEQLNSIQELRRQVDYYSQAPALLVAKADAIGEPSILVNMIDAKAKSLVDIQNAFTQAKAVEAFIQSPEHAKALVSKLDQNIVERHVEFLKESLIKFKNDVDNGTFVIEGAPKQALQDIISKLNNNLNQTGGGAPSLGSRLGDAVFSLSQEMKGSDQVMAAYMEAVYRKMLSPDEIKALGWDNMVLASVHASSNNLYPSFDAFGNMILNWYPGALVQGKGLPPGSGPGSAVRLRFGNFAPPEWLARLAAGTGTVGTISRFFIGFLRVISIPFAILATIASPAIMGFLERVLSGEFGAGAAGPAALRQYFGYGAPRQKKQTDWGLVAAMIIAIIPVAVGVLSTSSTFQNQLVAQGEGAQVGGDRTAGEGTFAGGIPPSEITEITTCPVDRGRITQRPVACYYWSPGVLNTHCNKNAYDIGYPATLGTTVVASHDGTVSVAGCDRWLYCPFNPQDIHPEWKGFGKFVILLGRHDDGSVFRTIYAHLISIDSNVNDGVVKAGEPIGIVDSTGKSSGHHLHFEYRGPRGNAPFLPNDCPFR